MTLLRATLTCGVARLQSGSSGLLLYSLRGVFRPKQILAKAKDSIGKTRVDALATKPTKPVPTLLKAISLGLTAIAPVVKAEAVKEEDKASGRLIKAKDVDLDREAAFDWAKFLSILQEHLLHLVAALATATAVAIINIQASYLCQLCRDEKEACEINSTCYFSSPNCWATWSMLCPSTV